MPRAQVIEPTELLRAHGALMQEVCSILEQEEKRDDLLRASILSSRSTGVNRIQGSGPEQLYGLEGISRSCARRRALFLPASHYPGTIPHAALLAVRRLEARSGASLGGFMIMAPAAHFRRCPADAVPWLFVPVGNGTYLLVHGPKRARSGWLALLGAFLGRTFMPRGGTANGHSAFARLPCQEAGTRNMQ